LGENHAAAIALARSRRVVASARDPALIKALRDNGALITISSPEETKAMLAEEVMTTASLVQILKLRQP
jgi:Trk K+ transport system NAD-binding subunit